MKEIFTIDCEEIILREYSLHDAESIYKIAQEEKVSYFLPDWKTSREQRIVWVRDYEIPGNKSFLKQVSEGEVPTGYLRLGIFLKYTNSFIGWCCVGPKEELTDPNTEIIYAISEEYEGRGFVTKAAKAVLNYIFSATKLQTINALARVDNEGSNKIIKKCNFEYVTDIEIDNEIFHHYKLEKDYWVTLIHSK